MHRCFLIALLASLCGLVAGGCGEESRTGRAPASESAGASSARASSGWSDDPRLVELRRALGEGRVDQARALHEQLAPAGGVEILLLGARLAALEGDEARASQRVEEARALAPHDARVFATAAEIHVAGGRMETADTEIQRGLAAAGACAELERARGVWLICTPGGAEKGLALLETALAHDPKLPFLSRPLGQACLLVAKERAREGDVLGAREEAERSLEHDPDDVDARRFLAETLAVLLDYGRAIALYESLLEDGVPVEIEAAQAYKNGAIAAMAMEEREQTVLLFLRARQLGMDDEALGSGVGILRDEARAEAAAALAAEEADEPAERDEHLVQALVYEDEIGADLLSRAALALDREDLDAGARLARQALYFEHADPRARALPALFAARGALGSGDLALARSTVRAALEEEPGNAWLAAERAWLMAYEAHAAGELDHASELAAAALAHQPEHARAHALCATLGVERGYAALEARDLAAAATHLRAALDHDPACIEAHQFLGVALFEAGDHAGAVRAFEAVLAIARAEDLDLPDPVHIQLARALFLAGETARARETLEDYLAAHPQGEFAEPTRAALDALPEPEPPGVLVEDDGEGG